jgi:hypothetical protein
MKRSNDGRRAEIVIIVIENMYNGRHIRILLLISVGFVTIMEI